jgi:protein TonB
MPIKFQGLVSALGLAFGAASAAAQPAASPQPARWHLDGSTDRCVLTRRLDGSPSPATFILRTIPGSGRYDVILASPHLPDPLRRAARSSQTLVLELSGASVEVPGASIDLPETLGNGVAVGPLPAELMPAFAQSTTIGRKVVGNEEGGRWAVPAAARAAEAMASCEDEKLADWGADPAGLAPGATPAKPAEDAGSWIRPRDLGLHDALASLAYTAFFRLSVGSDGRVKDCTLLESAGNVDLSRGCQILTRAARYSPARDASGNPVASVAIHVVDVRFRTDIRVISG